MFVSTHSSALWVALNLIVMENFIEWGTSPEKTTLFQPTKRPPEAPSEGT
jgi:hypothetical protein